MSGSSIIIMPSPRKSDIMNMQCNTGARYDSIQSGDTTSSQVYQYHVASVMYLVYLSKIQLQVIACQVPGVRYQVSGN